MNIMKKALFIHGLHSDSEFTTGGNVAEILKEHGYETIHPSFNLLDCKKTLTRIEQIVKEEKVSVIAAHSLGGFYGFIFPFEIKKILINPCLKPELEIPKLMFEGEVFPEKLATEWESLRQNATESFSNVAKAKIYGIFAKNDELFSFADFARNELGFEHVDFIDGGHKPTKEQLIPAIERIIK